MGNKLFHLTAILRVNSQLVQLFGWLLLVAFWALSSPANAVTIDPFNYLDTANPVRVAYPASSSQGASAFDLVASSVGPDSFYTTTMLGSPTAFGVAEYTLNRVPTPTSPWGVIQPLSNPIDPTENRRWQMPLNDTRISTYNKAVDILSEDSGTVRILTATEAGDSGLSDTHGTVELVHITDRSLGTGSASVWKDLTSQRADGNATYHPEGIAIDRANGRVAVVTDDGEASGRSQGARIYNFDGTFAESGTAQNYGLTTAGDAGSGDGRQATALADGSFLVRVGSGTERGIWKVDAFGNSLELLNDTQLGPVSVQDTIIRSPDGSNYFLYVALATPDAEIVAYEWDNTNQLLVDSIPDGQLSLESFKTAFGWSDAGYLSGLSFTTNGEMLMSFANSGSPGGVVAFNLLPLDPQSPAPEPSAFLLFGLGTLGLVRHTRRRRRKA